MKMPITTRGYSLSCSKQQHTSQHYSWDRFTVFGGKCASDQTSYGWPMLQAGPMSRPSGQRVNADSQGRWCIRSQMSTSWGCSYPGSSSGAGKQKCVPVGHYVTTNNDSLNMWAFSSNIIQLHNV